MKRQKLKKKTPTELTPEQYRICWKKGTERPFTGEYWNLKTPGKYFCVCCQAELFNSENKFDSGTGWPSFTKPSHLDSINETMDYSHNMERVEVTCFQCGAHLGHVFTDGPPPSGLRYCINSGALIFEPTPTSEKSEK